MQPLSPPVLLDGCKGCGCMTVLPGTNAQESLFFVLLDDGSQMSGWCTFVGSSIKIARTLDVVMNG